MTNERICFGEIYDVREIDSKLASCQNPYTFNCLQIGGVKPRSLISGYKPPIFPKY